MKAEELNGTHIGQRITISLDGANLTDVLREVSHEADLITEGTFGGRETTALGKQRTRLHFQRFGPVKVTPEAPVQIGADEPEAAPEQHPQGNNFAVTERKGNSLEPYEMHAGWRPDSYGSISLKWQPKAES